MINLKLFQTISEYEEYIGNEPILPNVSCVRESGVYYTPKVTVENKGLDPVLLDIAGTAIVYDVDNSSLMTIAGDDYNIEDYPQNKYEPVGVIIMPSSHTEDGYARMMSCKLMGVKTADDGTITYGSYDNSNVEEFDNEGGIAWANPVYSAATGATQALLQAYPDFPLATTIPSIDGGTSGVLFYTDMDDSEIIPMMLSANYLSDGNGGGWWADQGDTTVEEVASELMPSPYTTDGAINAALRTEGTSMAVIHGRTASDMVLDFTKTSGNRFDIFAAVDAYSTSGTKSGDWYVPSPLELAYFCAKMKGIYSTMNKLNPQFDEVFDALLSQQTGGDYSAPDNDTRYLASWSSSLYSSSYAWVGVLPIYVGGDYVNDNFYGFAVAPVRNQSTL